MTDMMMKPLFEPGGDYWRVTEKGGEMNEQRKIKSIEWEKHKVTVWDKGISLCSKFTSGDISASKTVQHSMVYDEITRSVRVLRKQLYHSFFVPGEFYTEKKLIAAINRRLATERNRDATTTATQMPATRMSKPNDSEPML
jgi:hypothetical protein